MFTWFAGYRMRFFAEQGLATTISDVWQEIGADYTHAFKQAATGQDGKQYFVPFTTTRGRSSTGRACGRTKGYEIPKTLDEFTALAAKMKSDGLVPIAFADKDGWPAMGTFDYLNMRVNGYDFHISLMAGKESWTDPKVKQVFDTWRGLLPHHQPGANGRTWQEAAQSLQQKKTGMYLLGMFVAQQFPETDLDDLDFFAFPEIDPQYGQDAVEAPIDGFMISNEGEERGRGQGAAQVLRLRRGAERRPKPDPEHARRQPRPTRAATARCRKGRRARRPGQADLPVPRPRHPPDFASTVMIPALQRFIGKPDDIDALLKDIEAQKTNIYPQ